MFFLDKSAFFGGVFPRFLALFFGQIFRLSRGVAAGVDFEQLRNRDLGVNRRRLKALVAELLLDESDVRAALKHVRRAGVAEQMATAALGEAGGAEPLRRQVREHVGDERRAEAAKKKRLLARVELEQRAHLGEVARDPAGGARAQGDNAIFFFPCPGAR